MLVSQCSDDSSRYSTRETHFRLVAHETVKPVSDGAWRNGPWVIARAALAGMALLVSPSGLCALAGGQVAAAMPATNAHKPKSLARGDFMAHFAGSAR
jgi:hypothetical protein